MQTLFLKGIAFKVKNGEDFYEITTAKEVGKQVNSVGDLSEIGNIGLLFTNLEEKLGYYTNESGFNLLSISLREKLVTTTDADGNKSKEPRWFFNFVSTTIDTPRLKLTCPVAKEISNDLQDKLWAEISQTIVALDAEVFANIDAIKNYKF